MMENANKFDSLVWLLHKEFVDQVFVLLRQLRLESNLLTHLVTGYSDLVASEWRISMHQLIQQNAECPDIEHVVVLPMINHLWCHILERTAKSVALAFVHLTLIIFFKLTFTRPSKITNF